MSNGNLVKCEVERRIVRYAQRIVERQTGSFIKGGIERRIVELSDELRGMLGGMSRGILGLQLKGSSGFQLMGM